MAQQWKRVRGFLGTGLTWALAWGFSSLAELSRRRVAALGAGAGVLVPVIFLGLLRVLFDERSTVVLREAVIGCSVVAALGALSAITMLSVARSA